MSSKKKGLGRGFSSLIPDELLDESFDPTAVQDGEISDLRQLSIEKISGDPGQPRREFDEAGLEELSSSIREHGVLQPIVVVSKGDGYEIVAGERRWRAATMAGLTKIPAIVRTLNAQHKLELSLIENLQRKDLNPLETATAYLKLRDQFNMSLDDIAQRMGARSVSAISNKMRLLKLPKFVKEAIVTGQISEGQARPLIGRDEKVLKELLPKIIEQQWSARRIEQYIISLKKQEQDDEPVKKASMVYSEHQDRLAKTLNTKVDIRTNSKGSGKISIAFKDAKDLERIEQLLRTQE